jgi:phosphate transport system substrate-binding protein
VHKDNPLAEISFEQLTELYAEDGKDRALVELGVKIPGASDDTIVRVSRQSSSGTYEFFREHALGNQDFRLGSRDLNGSKEVWSWSARRSPRSATAGWATRRRR